RDLTVVGMLGAGDEAEDGRFAGAVRPHQADLLAPMHRRLGLDEEDLAPVLLADLVEANHEAATCSAPPPSMQRTPKPPAPLAPAPSPTYTLGPPWPDR